MNARNVIIIRIVKRGVSQINRFDVQEVFSVFVHGRILSRLRSCVYSYFPSHFFVHAFTVSKAGVLGDAKGGGMSTAIVNSDDSHTVPVCHACHYQIDQGNIFSREERFAFWDIAYSAALRFSGECCGSNETTFPSYDRSRATAKPANKPSSAITTDATTYNAATSHWPCS